MSSSPTEQDVWGDDQLIASDVSIPFILQRADWTALFNSIGLDGEYPMVLFMHDAAEALHGGIIEGVNRAQVLPDPEKLKLSIYTLFVDSEASGHPRGTVRVLLQGLQHLESGLRPHFCTLLKSGVADWISEAYSTHGVIPSVVWLDESDPWIERTHALFTAIVAEDTEPTVSEPKASTVDQQCFWGTIIAS